MFFIGVCGIVSNKGIAHCIPTSSMESKLFCDESLKLSKAFEKDLSSLKFIHII